MAAKHKFQNARVAITTTLSPAQLVDLARAAGEAVTSTIPGQGHIKALDVMPMSVSFSVRSLGGITELMRFNFNVLENSGSSTGTSEIVMFRTKQPTYAMIPLGPKRLLGWAQYRKFAQNLRDAVMHADPAATFEFTERTLAGARA